MVPISKSIWPLILFVYANFYFVAIARFNSSFCFLKTFSRKRSSPSPPNFAPPFCAFCLIVCDFLPKTWNLGRKEGKSVLSGAPEGTPPVAYGDSLLGDGAFGTAAKFPAKAQSRLPGSTPSVKMRKAHAARISNLLPPAVLDGGIRLLVQQLHKQLLLRLQGFPLRVH